jgi:hypothetical protein
MGKQLQEAGIDPYGMKQKSLEDKISKHLVGGGVFFAPVFEKDKISKHLVGGSVFFAPVFEKDHVSLRQGLLLWSRKNVWWCLVLVAVLLGASLPGRATLYLLFATTLPRIWCTPTIACYKIIRGRIAFQALPKLTLFQTVKVLRLLSE